MRKRDFRFSTSALLRGVWAMASLMPAALSQPGRIARRESDRYRDLRNYLINKLVSRRYAIRFRTVIRQRP
ncbi:hypothetical protein [Burkholderia pseudomallei]|uniref:hypothetical protein n=1 Tax=Burkholderia pseudomallei TaxID=28450 RepID=UPI000A408051|nr:hypothetical protein [Burkholderia pseudomallei]